MLTETACKNAKLPDDKKRVRLADYGGLYLEITHSRKYWFWKYRFAGKEKRLALGSFPKTGLKQARLSRDAARQALAAGVDPVQIRHDKKLAGRVRHSNTFEIIARDWHQHWGESQSPRHVAYVLRRLEADAFRFQRQDDLRFISRTHRPFQLLRKDIVLNGKVFVARVNLWEIGDCVDGLEPESEAANG